MADSTGRIKVRCPECDGTMAARAGWIGRQAPCEHCGATIVFTAEQPDPPAARIPGKRKKKKTSRYADYEEPSRPVDDQPEEFWLKRIGPELIALVGLVVLCGIFAAVAGLKQLRTPSPTEGTVESSLPAQARGAVPDDRAIEDENGRPPMDLDKFVWLPQMTPASIGPVDITVTKTELGKVPLLDESGRTFESTTPLLALNIRVRNTSPAPVEYTGWMGLGTRKEITKDSHAYSKRTRRKYRVQKTIPPYRVEGVTHAAVIEPGAVHLDVVTFEEPSADSREFFVELASPIVGVEGVARFELDTFRKSKIPAAIRNPRSRNRTREDHARNRNQPDLSLIHI